MDYIGGQIDPSELGALTCDECGTYFLPEESEHDSLCSECYSIALEQMGLGDIC